MTAEYGLGRLHAPDSRDRKFLIQRPREAVTRTFRSHLSPGPALNQHEKPHCVAFSGTRYLTTLPVVNKPPAPPHVLYDECQQVDEWPGTDYDGTSVRAFCKVLKARGMIGEYRWAPDGETAADFILATGPLMFGTIWTSSMFQVDGDGYIWPKGSPVGGHAYLGLVINRRRKNPDNTVGAVRILNSWGEWGQKGRAWMTLGVLDELIRADGEAAMCQEIKL